MSEARVIAGLDIGNGYVKGRILLAGSATKVDVDIPSALAVVPRGSAYPTPDEEAGEHMDALFDELEVSYVSPLVADGYRRLFGERAIAAGNASLEEFDVVSPVSKAHQPLAHELVLGVLAGAALKSYVEEKGALPEASDVLDTRAIVALALPISEYMMHRDEYARTLSEGVHTVNIHNFTTPVTVKVSIESVVVLAEGASAHFAISKAGEPLALTMLNEARESGLVDVEGISAADIVGATSTIGIDIGEGTVNFPVFTDGAFNADASTSFAKGWGTVLSGALDAMERSGFSSGFSSRKRLGEYVMGEPKALKRAHHAKVSRYVAEQAEFFAAEVASKFSSVLANVGAVSEVAFVYGGGSGPLREVLYPKLVEKVGQSLGSSDALVVLYLSAQWSRFLNREGLVIAAKSEATRRGW